VDREQKGNAMNRKTVSAVEHTTELLNMLQDDHGNLKELFEQFEQTADTEERGAIIRSALKRLEVHAELEEKMFYPAVQKLIEDDGLIKESFEKHHVIHLLIKELKSGHVKHDRRDAKFAVLAENVKHHIKKEEESLFPEALVLDLDWEALSARAEKRKTQLAVQKHRSKRHCR
jgi:hemerythrin-like domain-containing protein